MNIESLSKYKALHVVYSDRGGWHLVEQMGLVSSDGQPLPLKRIQFDAHESLSFKLEQVCDLLDVSKREFCEIAISEALDKATKVFFATYRDVTGRDFGQPENFTLDLSDIKADV